MRGIFLRGLKSFYVYIMASEWLTTYVGITDDLERRVKEHRAGHTEFTKKYNINRLVWFETQPSREAAARREKEIKAWRRSKKVALITATNPDWKDLYEYSLSLLYR